MSCAHCRDVAQFFDRKVARRELARYRRRGPMRTTRMLVDAALAEGAEGRLLIDVGGGIGAIQHELLAAGARHVVNVDASPAYQEAARSEAEERGTAERIEFYTGDFVEVAPVLPPADFVTLDRVLCCYPNMVALVGASAEHARVLWGAVFPREYLALRLGMRLVNVVQRLRRSAFRIYNHSREDIGMELRRRGFREAVYRKTLMWQVMVWKKEE